jgi:peptidoglycan/xylan/chitin deacetylase (PgdA/CDA1 family)
MDTHTATTDGDPESTNHFINPLFITLLICITLASCNQHSNNEKLKPSADSAVVKKPKALNHAATAKKTATKKIYITFDDGPNNGTMNVLQTIREENIPVSFFIVGKHVFDSPKQTAVWNELLADTAIELCNHSYSHAHNKYSSFYKNPQQVIADFKESQHKLQFKNDVTRMPGRNAWRIDTIDVTDIKESKAAIDSVHTAGFNIMGWDIEWSFDHKTFVPDQDTALLYKKIFNLLDAGTTRTPGHLVLLAHDQAFQDTANLAILHSFLRGLKHNNEYEFSVADMYPGVKKP